MYLGHITSWILFITIFIYCLQTSQAGGGKKGNSRIIELLTAGIVAKVLQKQNYEGGGGGGGGSYYPIPIPLPVGGGGGGGQKHHHITEKIIPIPVPHHTTRIIHINAGDHQGHHEHHGYDGGSSHHEEEDDYGSHNHHGHGSSRIQQLLLHDNGIYNTHQRPPTRIHYRMPTMRHSHPQVRYLAQPTPYGTQIIQHRIPFAPVVGYRQMQPVAFNAYPVLMHHQFRPYFNRPF